LRGERSSRQTPFVPDEQDLATRPAGGLMMVAPKRRPNRPFVWVAFYAAVIAAVFVIRGQMERPGTGLRFSAESDTVKTITLAGLELAPDLVPQIIKKYQDLYPQLHVIPEDGGTVRALEALANRRAAVGLLYRLPTRDERALVRAAVNDTVLCFPVALGGVAILANALSGVESFAMDDLRRLARDEADPRFDRLYAPDPNQGLWDAFRISLGVYEEAARLPASATPEYERITFLKDEAAVIEAVLADPRGLGIASTLSMPDSLPEFADGRAVRAVPVLPDTGLVPVEPGYEQIGYGEYPLYHYLYVACLGNGSTRGSMFVTHLTSDRGQRHVERAGYLPARQSIRQIYLTRHPLGSKSN
jgi:ABC-type phosphate transport system substrate-binding protein